MSEFAGVFPAAITPMTEAGELDEEVFRQVLEFNIQAGVHGFWLAGGTGESVMLEDAENQRIATIAADQSRGRVTNIMHVGQVTTGRAARLADHAASAGVESICCVPPFFYSRDEKAIVEHYRVVGAAADLPLFVYNLPGCTGTEITPDLLAEIQDTVPQLRGLKHSAASFYNIQLFAEMGLDCFVGSAALMLPALTIGASGCVDGLPHIAPEIWVEQWNAWREGDLSRARALQGRIGAIYRLFFGGDYHAAVKVMLSHRLGVDCGVPRPPGLPLTADRVAQLQQGLDDLGLGRIAGPT